MDRIAGWWDGAELWIAGLPFVPQVALVLVVAVPACWAVAAGLDRALAAMFVLLARDTDDAEEN